MKFLTVLISHFKNPYMDIWARTKAVETVFTMHFPSILLLCQNPPSRAPCPCLACFCVARTRLPNGRLSYSCMLSVSQSQGVFQMPLDRIRPNIPLTTHHVTQMRPADWPSAQRPLPVWVVYHESTSRGNFGNGCIFMFKHRIIINH